MWLFSLKTLQKWLVNVSHSENQVFHVFFVKESIPGVKSEKKYDGGPFLALFLLKRAKKGQKRAQMAQLVI